MKELILILATAALTASFTQLAVLAYDKYKESGRKALIKKLIRADLKNLSGIYDELKEDYQKLIGHLNTSTSRLFWSDAYAKLHTDIYDAISKAELFEVFSDDLLTLASTYKAVHHFKDNIPGKLFQQYVTNYNPSNPQLYQAAGNKLLDTCKMNIRTLENHQATIKTLL